MFVRTLNSQDPDQTAPSGAAWSGSALFDKAFCLHLFDKAFCLHLFDKAFCLHLFDKAFCLHLFDKAFCLHLFDKAFCLVASVQIFKHLQQSIA